MIFVLLYRSLLPISLLVVHYSYEMLCYQGGKQRFEKLTDDLRAGIQQQMCCYRNCISQLSMSRDQMRKLLVLDILDVSMALANFK